MTTTTFEQYSSQIEQALRKSFNFGQTYWQQADSESIAQQNKSDETREKFNKFVDDIVFTLAPPTISEQSNPASALEQYKERCLRVADLLRKENHGWNSFSYTQAINDFSTAIAALPLPVMPMIHKTIEHLGEVKKITLLGQWQCDGTVEAFDVDGMMVIPQEDGVVYVRKEDAIQFFDLVPVMPEQADPVANYAFSIPPLPQMAFEADIIEENNISPNHDPEFRQTYIDLLVAQENKRQWRAYARQLKTMLETLPMFNPSALLGRVAELEAENVKLKEDIKSANFTIKHKSEFLDSLINKRGLISGI